jgi:hypothetical protein
MLFLLCELPYGSGNVIDPWTKNHMGSMNRYSDIM